MKLYDKVEPYIWLLIICSFLYFILPISVVSLLPKYSNIITIIFVLVIKMKDYGLNIIDLEILIINVV